MKLIFELGVEGRGMTLMPECDVPEYQLPEERSEALDLPHVSENELTRHYTALCKRIHGVNDGFYPLGSCTMKYNPKIDEDMAALPGFTLAEQRTLRGTITLRTNADIEALFCMTPYYYKSGARDQAKLHALDTLTTETEFALLIYRKA